PVYPRLDAEGFRALQRESLEELALASAQEAKRTRRPQLLPPLSPAERRLIHLALASAQEAKRTRRPQLLPPLSPAERRLILLALAEDPEVETESEGDGFLK